MTTNSSEISVAELDFDLIKTNLIEYFKSDSTFQDYEFEGSALNILMDVLSYNTHMNSVIANMSANEMFIDSAQLRQSIISLAKAIGYTPRSKRTAVAEITLTFTDITSQPAYITMPAGTRFSTSTGIIFSTKEQLLIYPKADGLVTEYEITGVEIYEGYFNNVKYDVDYTKDQNFLVPSVDVDTTSLRVTNVSGSVISEFIKNENITLATPETDIYFLHQNPDDIFEVTFGDGIIGRKPINNSEVNISYIISKHGEDANNSDVFKKNQVIDGYSAYTITTTVPAYGAADMESKDSVQLKSPRMYKAQSRAVVVEDYENFMLTEYPWIESMSIWGGEYNDPPIYGKVFLAIKPSHTEFLSESLKERIKDDLIKKYNVVTVIPEIIDPDYLFILINSAVEYDISATTLAPQDITTLVADSITNYFEDNTELFNKPFYYSKLTSSIDNSDQSIANSLTDLRMMKRFYPSIGVPETREIKFSNPIEPGTVNSSYYNLSGATGNTSKQVILDDALGNLYTRNLLTNEIVHESIGSVDYLTGIMDFNITVYEAAPDTLDLRIYCVPSIVNVTPGYNQIILLDDSPAKNEYGKQQGVTITTTAENKEYK